MEIFFERFKSYHHDLCASWHCKPSYSSLHRLLLHFLRTSFQGFQSHPLVKSMYLSVNWAKRFITFVPVVWYSSIRFSSFLHALSEILNPSSMIFMTSGFFVKFLLWSYNDRSTYQKNEVR